MNSMFENDSFYEERKEIIAEGYIDNCITMINQHFLNGIISKDDRQQYDDTNQNNIVTQHNDQNTVVTNAIPTENGLLIESYIRQFPQDAELHHIRNEYIKLKNLERIFNSNNKNISEDHLRKITIELPNNAFQRYMALLEIQKQEEQDQKRQQNYEQLIQKIGQAKKQRDEIKNKKFKQQIEEIMKRCQAQSTDTTMSANYTTVQHQPSNNEQNYTPMYQNTTLSVQNVDSVFNENNNHHHQEITDYQNNNVLSNDNHNSSVDYYDNNIIPDFHQLIFGDIQHTQLFEICDPINVGDNDLLTAIMCNNNNNNNNDNNNNDNNNDNNNNNNDNNHYENNNTTNGIHFPFYNINDSANYEQNTSITNDTLQDTCSIYLDCINSAVNEMLINRNNEIPPKLHNLLVKFPGLEHQILQLYQEKRMNLQTNLRHSSSRSILVNSATKINCINNTTSTALILGQQSVQQVQNNTATNYQAPIIQNNITYEQQQQQTNNDDNSNGLEEYIRLVEEKYKHNTSMVEDYHAKTGKQKRSFEKKARPPRYNNGKPMEPVGISFFIQEICLILNGRIPEEKKVLFLPYHKVLREIVRIIGDKRENGEELFNIVGSVYRSTDVFGEFSTERTVINIELDSYPVPKPLPFCLLKECNYELPYANGVENRMVHPTPKYLFRRNQKGDGREIFMQPTSTGGWYIPEKVKFKVINVTNEGVLCEYLRFISNFRGMDSMTFHKVERRKSVQNNLIINYNNNNTDVIHQQQEGNDIINNNNYNSDNDDDGEEDVYEIEIPTKSAWNVITYLETDPHDKQNPFLIVDYQDAVHEMIAKELGYNEMKKIWQDDSWKMRAVLVLFRWKDVVAAGNITWKKIVNRLREPLKSFVQDILQKTGQCCEENIGSPQFDHAPELSPQQIEQLLDCYFYLLVEQQDSLKCKPVYSKVLEWYQTRVGWKPYIKRKHKQTGNCVLMNNKTGQPRVFDPRTRAGHIYTEKNLLKKKNLSKDVNGKWKATKQNRNQPSRAKPRISKENVTSNNVFHKLDYSEILQPKQQVEDYCQTNEHISSPTSDMDNNNNQNIVDETFNTAADLSSFDRQTKQQRKRKRNNSPKMGSMSGENNKRRKRKKLEKNELDAFLQQECDILFQEIDKKMLYHNSYLDLIHQEEDENNEEQEEKFNESSTTSLGRLEMLNQSKFAAVINFSSSIKSNNKKKQQSLRKKGRGRPITAAKLLKKKPRERLCNIYKEKIIQQCPFASIFQVRETTIAQNIQMDDVKAWWEGSKLKIEFYHHILEWLHKSKEIKDVKNYKGRPETEQEKEYRKMMYPDEKEIILDEGSTDLEMQYIKPKYRQSDKAKSTATNSDEDLINDIEAQLMKDTDELMYDNHYDNGQDDDQQWLQDIDSQL